MPACYKCGRVESSAEMRRTTKSLPANEQAWACRDSHACKHRRKWAKRARKEHGPGSGEGNPGP